MLQWRGTRPNLILWRSSIKSLTIDEFPKANQLQKSKPLRSPGRLVLFEIAALLLLLLLLVLADILCYQQALPVVLEEQAGQATLQVGSQTVPLGFIGTPISLQFPRHDPVVHEYQLDGTDSTNNLTLDTTYLDSIVSSPYYLFQSWMRNLDGTSRWSDLRISSNGLLLASEDWPANGEVVSLQGTTPQSSLHLQVILHRPETPMTLNLMLADNSVIQITLDRNNRKITVMRDSQVLANAFFPVDVLPFAAMVIDTMLRTIAWAIVLLLVVLVCEIALAVIRHFWFPDPHEGGDETVAPLAVPCRSGAARPAFRFSLSPLASRFSLSPPASRSPLSPPASRSPLPRFAFRFPLLTNIWRDVTRALHPVALVALLVSFCFVAWIAYVQYHAEPHIYDASAYLFSAKMYATGHLAVPALAVLDRFPGPFMIQYGGQWFGQYAPGTGLTLVPGIWLGLPWLVEPILGTFALLGVGLIAARLFDRRVATLAVFLGVLSPFYSYIAASYLSHAVALFYLTWGLWALLRFFQGEARWNLPLATFFFGMGYLTRNEPALLFVAVAVSGMILIFWRRVRVSWRHWILPGIAAFAGICVFIAFTLNFNTLLTHNPSVAPRSLFFAGDHWGFGAGVGFYGQHTLAAGLVNLDELLTVLAIDLYGWPFYLTLAFLALPFLTRRATAVDWFCLLCLIILAGAYVGYFYHGIYLGPRYLFETLPFLLILTARGILTLAAAGRAARDRLSRHLHPNASATPQGRSLSIPTVVLIISLMLSNLLYFLPRQIELHHDYTGLPNGYHIDVAAIYHPTLHNAIVVTSDYTIYQFVLFPLNDPFLRDDVLYAWASNTADYTELQKAFPNKHLYRLYIAPDGSVSYVPLQT
jgi:hypothetical protein